MCASCSIKFSVTVITPSYNSSRFLQDNIQSVKNQTHPLIEHIIVDGGSTDGTLNILKKHDRIMWISERDKGFAHACNKGLHMAKGAIINIQNADDYFYSEESIEQVVEVFRNNPSVAMVFGDCNHVDTEGSIVWNGLGYGSQYSLKNLLCSKVTLPQGSTFFKRNVAFNVGLLNQELWVNEEVHFFMKIALKHPVVYLPKVLSCYRLHEGQLTKRLTPTFRKRVVDKLLTFNPQLNMIQNQLYEGASDFELYKLWQHTKLFNLSKRFTTLKFFRFLKNRFPYTKLAVNKGLRTLYRWIYW